MNIEYINPRIKKFSTIDDLLKNHNRANYAFDENSTLSIDDLLDKNFICIVGEPGIGKSRLIEEIKCKLQENAYHCTASAFIPAALTSIPEYCLIDALDEVDDSQFISKLKEIIGYHKNHPKVKIIFSCRKHYISSYVNHFATVTSLTYIELCILSRHEVDDIISKYCSEVTKKV